MKRLWTGLLLGLSLGAPAWGQELSGSASLFTNDYPDWRLQLGEPNPASLSFYGTGRLQLPSVRLDVGSTLATDRLVSQGSQLGNSFANVIQKLNQNQELGEDADVFKAGLESFLGQFQQTSRLDYELDVNLLGFGGAPFSALQIAGRPLSLGLSLSSNTRGFVEARFSEAFTNNLQTLGASLPELFETGVNAGQISTNSTNLLNQVSSLQTDIGQLLQQANSFSNNPSIGQLQSLNQSITSINSQVDSLLPTARELTSLVSNTTTSARSLLDSLESFSGGGASLTAASDLHMTLGVSGAYPVYMDENIQVAVGGRLKLFLLPYNVPLQNLGIQSDAGLMGKLELKEVSGLQNAEDLRSSLDTFSSAVTTVNQTIDQAEAVSNQLKEVQTDIANNNLAGAAAKGSSLAQQGSSLVNQLNSTRSTVAQASQEMAGIQQTLLQELQDISYKGTLTTPSGAGFGVDLGVDAILFRYLRLGLQLQNPLVLWPGTERPFEGKFVSNQQGRTVLQPSFNLDDSAASNVNYTATVPLTALLNARYRFDGLLPEFTDFYGLANLEFVANGRTPAVTLGVQKFFNDLAYAGLGGRLGGISSMIYLEGGLNPLHGFGLDAQLGISPAGQGLPAGGLGWLSVARLGLSYRF